MSEQRIFYGRVAGSVVLYVLFMILSTVAVFTGGVYDQGLWLAALLLGATFLLPRTPRHPKRRVEADTEEVGEGSIDDEDDAPREEDDQARKEQAGRQDERDDDVRRWLTWTRAAYLVIAVILWFGLPAVIG